jgi:hypothetical protein
MMSSERPLFVSVQIRSFDRNDRGIYQNRLKSLSDT